MTHVVGMVTACSLFVVKASQIIILPSWDELTMCLLSRDQSEQSTFPWCPLSTLRGLMFRLATASSLWATVDSATSLSFLRSSSRRALSCSISRVSVSTVSGAWWSTFIVVPSVAIFGVPGADGRRKR
uniref:Putative secreted protein n=1 Tax=Ixodes ricinus TaxID=34613 RepID=A0A6B0UQA5_IXORI